MSRFSDPPEEPEEGMHSHTCQQCDRVVIPECECDEPEKAVWCSSRCREAFDL